MTQQITVGPNVQVSKDRPRMAHYELWGGGDLTNPDRLIACAMAVDVPGSQVGTVFYVSHDRGKSWKMSLESREGAGENADPVCEFGPGGVAYAISLVGGGRPNHPTVPAAQTDPHRQTQFYRSADGGLSWDREPARIGLMDRPAFAADNTAGTYHGRLYVAGQHDIVTLDDQKMRAVHVYRSLDGGRTFLGPASRHAAGEPPEVLGKSAVLSDGTLVLPVYGGLPSTHLSVVRSVDGGETLEREVKVTDGVSLTALAVDRSAAFKDRLYLVWRGGSEERPRIMLSYSADKGMTWSPPKPVDDARARRDGSPGPQLTLPSVEVNRDGVVGVSWYDTRDHADNLGWDLRFAASLDGGETFTPSERISSESNTFTGKEVVPLTSPYHGEIAGDRDGLRLEYGIFWFSSQGDTNGMAVGADGTFHPFWIDNRTGVSQLWTAPVRVHGTVARNGDSALAEFVDVSDRISVTMARLAFDRTTGELTCAIRMKNTSREPLRGPLKLRLISIESGWSPTVTARGAENGRTGVGAVWDLTPLLGDGTLAPEEESGEWNLMLVLAEARAFGPNVETTEGHGLARPVFRVLAGGVGAPDP